MRQVSWGTHTLAIILLRVMHKVSSERLYPLHFSHGIRSFVQFLTLIIWQPAVKIVTLNLHASVSLPTILASMVAHRRTVRGPIHRVGPGLIRATSRAFEWQEWDSRQPAVFRLRYHRCLGRSPPGPPRPIIRRCCGLLCLCCPCKLSLRSVSTRTIRAAAML